MLELEDKLPFKVKFSTLSEQLFIVNSRSRAVVNAVMNRRVPQNGGNFLTSLRYMFRLLYRSHHQNKPQ